MKKLKIFPKTFLYSLAIMLLIVGVAHLILYLLLPQMVISSVSIMRLKPKNILNSMS